MLILIKEIKENCLYFLAEAFRNIISSTMLYHLALKRMQMT